MHDQFSGQLCLNAAKGSKGFQEVENIFCSTLAI